MIDAMFLPCGQQRSIVALYKKEGSPFWWADIRMDGKRHRISTKQKVKGAARTFEAALIQQLSSGGIRKRVILRDYAQDFLAYVAATQLSDNTKKYYRDGWRLMKDQRIAGVRIDAITKADAEVLQVPHSGSNMNCALRTLRRMLSLAAEKGLIQRVPKIPLVEEVERDRVIAADEEMIILAKAPKTLRDVYLLVADCGIRPDNAARISWADVDFTVPDIFIVGGKAGKKEERHVAMSERVKAMLVTRASNGSQWVFPSPRRHGHHVTAKSISSNFATFKKGIGMPDDLVLYSARHTFATDVTEATGNLTKTQKALGHRSIRTTARYNHTKSAEIAEIINVRNSERHNLGHTTDKIQ
jgi:integrase